MEDFRLWPEQAGAAKHGSAALCQNVAKSLNVQCICKKPERSVNTIEMFESRLEQAGFAKHGGMAFCHSVKIMHVS